MSTLNQAISTQNTRMYIEDPDSAPQATGSVLTITRSEPAIVTFDDVSRLSDGDPVLILGTGWTSIDGQTWILQELNGEAKSAYLAGSSTTNEAAAPRVGAFRLNAFEDVCATTYTISPAAAAEIDTTTLCDEKKTSLLGFRDPGTLTFDYFINPVSPQTRVLQAAYDEGETRMFQIVYRNGAVLTLPVQVQTITETGGVDQAIQGSASLKIVSAPTLTLPPGTEEGATYDLIISVVPHEGAAPLSVVLTIVEYGNTASQFLVDWGDDSTPQIVVTHVGTHTYTEPGEFRPRVTPTVQGYPTAPFYGPTVYVSGAPDEGDGEPEGLAGAAA